MPAYPIFHYFSMPRVLLKYSPIIALTLPLADAYNVLIVYLSLSFDLHLFCSLFYLAL
ncbi:hypothetical protein D3C80_1256470 [compost metagenome]